MTTGGGFQEQSAKPRVNSVDTSLRMSIHPKKRGYMRLRSWLAILVMLLGSVSSLSQTPAQKVAEKEPELRKELERMVKEDQDIRGEFDRWRKTNGLMVNNKIYNEKMNSDPALKAAGLDITGRMIRGDHGRTLRLKEIVARYGWPGKSLVGIEGRSAAYLLIAHAVKDPATGAPDVEFQRFCVDLMSKLATGEVEGVQLASLTDRVLLYEGKKQVYGMMLTRNEKNEKVPQPIEDEAHVDERRKKIGLESLDEYLRKEGAVRGTPAKP